jgi:hypothetical protein
MRYAIRSIWMAVVITLCIESADVRADDDDLPTGEWGLIGALRGNTGEAGDAYNWGWLLGFAAGYQFNDYPFGLNWSILWGRFQAKDTTRVDDTLSVVEMSFGLSARIGLGDVPQFLFATGGGTLFRGSVALPPDQERVFVGPYAGAGYEFYMTDSFLLNLEGRYGLIAGGPAGFTALMSLNFGTGGDDK